MTCQARQHNDQMMCGTCGLQWDVDDPEPPECRPGWTEYQREGELQFKKLREILEKTT